MWDPEVDGIREKRRQKIPLKDMVKKESSKVGINEKNALDKKKWREGVSSWHKSQ